MPAMTSGVGARVGGSEADPVSIAASPDAARFRDVRTGDIEPDGTASLDCAGGRGRRRGRSVSLDIDGSRECEDDDATARARRRFSSSGRPHPHFSHFRSMCCSHMVRHSMSSSANARHDRDTCAARPSEKASR